jgi:integrase
MASISNDSGGSKRILFFDKDNNRPAIHLGRISKSGARAIKARVESINAALIGARALDGDDAAWLARIGDALHAKLAAVGLVPPRVAVARVLLAEFLDAFIAGRTDHRPNTTRTILQARDRLVAHFGADRPIDSITEADAEDWQTALRTRGYKPATIGNYTKKAKQTFRYAVRKKLLTSSPFAELKAPPQVDKSREAFIDLPTIHKAIDAAPDAEWRLIIALSRFGGLRCPSEHMALRWPDVEWDKNRLRVDSPKTGVRYVPLFPELRAALEEAFDPEAVYVIQRHRGSNATLRAQFLRILRKAGVKPWERLFHNLRASRQTELVERFPAHVVCSWIGNTETVAARHYLQVTDDHFSRAAGSAPDSALAPQTSAFAGAPLSDTEYQPSVETAAKAGEMAENGVFCGVGNDSREAYEQAMLDTMDSLTGWCHPSAELLPEKPR